METALTVIHISASVFLVVIVLLQHGKGADLGATLGGGSQTVLGTGGAATFLSKVTVVAAVTFMVSSLTLAHLSSKGTRESLFADDTQQEETTKPAVDAQETPASEPKSETPKTPEKSPAK